MRMSIQDADSRKNRDITTLSFSYNIEDQSQINNIEMLIDEIKKLTTHIIINLNRYIFKSDSYNYTLEGNILKCDKEDTNFNNILKYESDITDFIDNLNINQINNLLFYKHISNGFKFENKIYELLYNKFSSDSFNEDAFDNIISELKCIKYDKSDKSKKVDAKQYLKSHVSFYIFYHVYKRKHYVENNMERDLNLLNELFHKYNTLKNNNHENIKINSIIKFVKNNYLQPYKSTNIRNKLFSLPYNNKCYIFNCSICMTGKNCEYDETDDFESYFMVTDCFHTFHRQCIEGFMSNNNNKTQKLGEMHIKGKNKIFYIYNLYKLECQDCRLNTYIYI